MTITIASEVEAEAELRAKAEGISLAAYVERLIREDEEWGERSGVAIEDPDSDFPGIRNAIDEGLEQAEGKPGRLAEHVFAALRKKHGLPR